MIPTVFSAQHQGKRGYQEDSFLVTEDNELAAFVFDGLGGHADGADASKMTRDFFKKYLYTNDLDTLLLMADKNLYDEETKRVKASDGFRKPMGTTVAGIIVKDGEIISVSVGDSLIYRVQPDGLMTLMNNLHEWPNGALMYAIGAGGFTETSIKTHNKVKGDLWIIATDGIETLEPREIMNIVSFDSSGNKAQSLVDAVVAKDRKYQDNVTVLTVQF